MDDLLEAIRTDHRQLTPRELLHQPARALLGVSPDAETLLEALEIRSIFDLATSAVFEGASKLVQAGSDLSSALSQHGTPTGDLVRETIADGKKINELQYLPVGVLEAIPDAQVPGVTTVLDVQTVRDLALYPPYLAAKNLLTSVYFPENVAAVDLERPADLLPKTGDYPTERVQYTTLLMDAIQPLDGAQMVDIASPAFQPISLQALAKGDTGFKTIAFGALLTFNQSWYAQGVTLGQLLHSASLAPGESTRIAVVDWSRKSKAGETEVISEVDDLANDTSHNRSISEVTQAVANEAQHGFSEANSNSRSTAAGTSSAAELSAPLGGLLGGPSGSVGHTSSEATTDTHADSYSSSFGHRDVASSMMQNVNDRTHQHAHSARSRRASVVKEVSQSEHDGVSTRVLANYNHMHSLNIQYYEVVQIYRTEVALVKADKVVFIPVALVDFNDDGMVRRFQGVLARAALSYDIRDALRTLDTLELAPERDTVFSRLGSPLTTYLSSALSTHVFATRVPLHLDAATKAADMTAAAFDPEVKVRLSVAMPVVQRVNEQLWSNDQTARLSSLLGRLVLRPESTAIHLPTDVVVEGAGVDAGGAPVTVAFHTLHGDTITNVSPPHPLQMTEVSRITLAGSSTERDLDATVTLTLNRNGVRFPLELPAVTIAKGATLETRVVTVRAGGVNSDLKQHLMQHQLFYSQAVFRSLDTSQLALVLAGYGVEHAGAIVPVAQVVEPKPIRYVGNYLAFKMASDREQDPVWSKWLETHGIQVGSTKEDLVPLPSGGTFAEAVLGRSNSAEKLDITRFWNWKDSPAPLQPTEIAAIQTGSRATPEDVKPGQLSNPIINITTPTSLPDPMGTAAILAAVQNGSMFRDMSGLQGTLGLAQAALQATSAGAATAGQQAGTNMNSLLQANTERQRIAAEMITSLAKTAASAYTGGLAGGGGGGISGGSNHSQDGAKINYFDKAPAQPGGGTSNGSAGGAVAPVGGGGASGGGASSGSAAHGASNGSAGGGYSGNPAALAATWGDSQPPTGLITRLVDKFGGVIGGGDETASSPLTTRKAWPKLDQTTVLDRIKVLGADANQFNQGAIGLCTAACFYHHAIQKKSAEFVSFANALYGGGIGYLGNLRVSPGTDLRNADYNALAAKTPSMPQQADWMLMSSLRDSENWFFDFEGAADEDTAMKTSSKELRGFYEKTGFWTKAVYDDTRTVAAVKAITKTANTQVTLWIREQLLQPGNGTHVITVEGPMTINEGADTISFDYWTWAQPVKTLSTKLSTFMQSYLGNITATA